MHREVRNQGLLQETSNNSVLQNGESKVGTARQESGGQHSHITKGVLNPAKVWTFS